MNFIKVSAWHCDQEGKPNKLMPQEHFKLNIDHILAINGRTAWLKENVIQLNGNYYCGIQIDNEISLDSI